MSHATQFESALAAYLETVNFTDTDENEDVSENYEGFSEEFSREAESDVKKFLSLPIVQLAIDNYNLESVMHDFWFTRNHHGAGFWDGDYPMKVSKAAVRKFGLNWVKGENLGDYLTTVANTFQVIETSEGDDNLLYSCTSYQYRTEQEWAEFYAQRAEEDTNVESTP